MSEKSDRTVGFLYISRKNSIYLQVKEFNRHSKTAVFAAWTSLKTVRSGQSFPYVDYYWSPKEVSFALEPAAAWKKVRFKPEDSVRYHDPKVPGWWTSHVASASIPKDAKDVHIVKEGWNHEHCYLCKARIGGADALYGYYSKRDNDWLCVSCYKEFIARHDLRFLQFKK